MTNQEYLQQPVTRQDLIDAMECLADALWIREDAGAVARRALRKRLLKRKEGK